MKKLLTILLLLSIVASVMNVTVLAVGVSSDELDGARNATSESTVIYRASSNNTGDEAEGETARDEESWTVTVPAAVEVNTSGATVTVVGAFPESKTLNITAPETVTLYLDGDENKDYAVLSVDFDDISLVGSYKVTSVSADADVSVQDMGEIRFGVWRGTLTFAIEMTDTEGWVVSDILNNN